MKKLSNKLILFFSILLAFNSVVATPVYAESKKKVVKKKVAKATSTKPRQAKPYSPTAQVQTTSNATTTTTLVQTKTDNNEDANKTDKKSDSLKDVFSGSSNSKGPLDIKSDTLELNSKDRIFTYKGNVELTRDDMRVTAKKLEGRYDQENRMETVVCIGDVVITKGPSIKATSNRALYKVAASIVELTEGPELYRDGNILVADKVTIFLNEERSEAEGNVRVKVTKTNDQGVR